jgi:tripartite-type tricarboxylate transporter receptor subunit TctC
MTNTLVALHRAGLRCRVVLRRLVVTAILALPGMSSQASDSYPDQPVHIVVPYGGGGIADQVPRLLGNQLQRHFGQAFIIESKPGAGGLIGENLFFRQPR